VLASRLIAVALGPSAKMVTSGIGVGCWLILFPSWIWFLTQLMADKTQNTRVAHARTMGIGLLIGLALSILLRMLGGGFDVSTYGWTQVLGWVGAALCIGIASRLPTDVTQIIPKTGSKPVFWRIVGLSMGVSSVLLCIYFAFMSPNVIARWTGVPYPLIISVLVPILGVFAGLLLYQPRRILNITRKNLVLWNILFLLSLTLTLFAHQINFTDNLGAYPLLEPPVNIVYHIPLFCFLLLSPVVFVDFIHFIREMLVLCPTIRQLGMGFALAAGFMLLLILAQVFTTVYDYIPVIGPWFRDRFWLVFLCVGFGFAIPVLLLRDVRIEPDAVPITPQPSRLLGGTILFFAGLSLVIAWSNVPQPPLPAGTRTLRILTYNIQQGYSEGGVKNFAGQLDVLRDVDADIIGLQESDTNRVAGGNSDIVGYFARELNMYAYYGPKTVPGTFGIALLSKYPIKTAETFYMYSIREQTAAIYALIQVDGRDYHVYVTHLGNGGPIEQQKAILKHIQGREDVILMGDFNFKPDSDQYNLTTSSLADAWLAQNIPVETGPELDPNRRIDHIFVTPGTHIDRSRYLVSPQSDHPALWAELTW